MAITADLERARCLAFAAQEEAAKDLLVSLLPEIEQVGRDDWMLEAYALLGEIYLVRTAYSGTEECLHRMRDCLAGMSVSSAELDRMVRRYSRRAQFLQIGLAAAHGDHESAEAELIALTDDEPDVELAAEHRFLTTYAELLCAIALCDDDLHMRSIPLWQRVIDAIEHPADRGALPDDFHDHLLVLGATGYGRFCVETGRLSEADPWLRRAGARAEARGWRLAVSRTQLERATAAWSAGDRAQAQTLVHAAYPAIAEHMRAHDVSRCWLYFGLISISVEAFDDADERLGYAERHWREIEKPLHIHRILLQRSWVDIFRGDFAAARDRVAQARELLDGWPRHSWLQYARLDDQLGSIWRADALADPVHAAEKLERAAELKVPAALAVDSVRHSIPDADARMRWATHVSAPILAGAFAVAWEWGNTNLVSELIEYHTARGTFSSEPGSADTLAWADTATAAVPVESAQDYALVAAGPSHDDPALARGASLTKLGPLPPLMMDPTTDPIIRRYRTLAAQRYGRDVTADEPAWSTWP
ncbi:hypothetical protein DQP55_17640 [Mycolicibacterium sp. GF69]|uniref:hypothetical protein n=1 Tax=Mycolicibacterium sp. GF69 TaxID=2267251 RepID=UPI000DCC0455|nr:hypothetical protein [Mycolicibacterium sp. GF69]RAV09376.1 hypothetical protein DQP55_17640 [Mycolicibacterium sp. GF69]